MKKHLFFIFFILSLTIPKVKANTSETLKDALVFFCKASVDEMWNMLDRGQEFLSSAEESFNDALTSYQKEDKDSNIFDEEYFDTYKNNELYPSNNKIIAKNICIEGIRKCKECKEYFKAKKTRSGVVEEEMEKIITSGVIGWLTKWLPACVKNKISPQRIRCDFGKLKEDEIDNLSVQELLAKIFIEKETDLPHQTIEHQRKIKRRRSIS